MTLAKKKQCLKERRDNYLAIFFYEITRVLSTKYSV